MHSLSDATPKNPRGDVATARLITAYQAVFGGKASAEDTDIVMVDLANTSGYFRTLGPGRTHDERAFDDGRRWLFQRIVEFVGKEGQDMLILQRRAAREHAIDYPSHSSPYGDEPLDDYD